MNSTRPWADYVVHREWHKSQTFEMRPDGSALMRLDVSIDQPLRRWILGFGAAARVVAPLRLAQEILECLEDARERYMPRLAFDMARMSAIQSLEREAQNAMPMKMLWRAS